MGEVDERLRAYWSQEMAKRRKAINEEAEQFSPQVVPGGTNEETEPPSGEVIDFAHPHESEEDYAIRARVEENAEDAESSRRSEEISKASFGRFVKHVLTVGRVRKALAAEEKLKGSASKATIDYDVLQRLFKIFDASIKRLEDSDEYYEKLKEAALLTKAEIIEKIIGEEKQSPGGSVSLVAMMDVLIHRNLIG